MKPSRLLPTTLALALAAAPLLAQADSPDPERASERWGDHDVVAGQLLVQFREGTSAVVQHVRHEQFGGRVLGQLDPELALVALPAGRDLQAGLSWYGGRAEVLAVEPDVLHRPTTLVPSDTKWNLQWGPSKIGATSAWQDAQGDADCIVAIIDSGVHTSHADLDDHYAFGWDHYADDAVPNDVDGHGTHCAGIAAAETDNASGVAGMGFDCRYAAYRAGNATFATSDLVAAINDAVADGCHVLSMSWGSSYNSWSIRNALQDAADAGCVLVAAAGNDGVTSKFYPAGLSHVIAVGSSAPNDTRSTFSNHGAWVDVAAPGQSIYSTYNNGGYVYMNGTSMACPLVAGLGTLLYSELGGVRSVANAQLIRDALQDSAVDVGSWVAHGRIDAPAALAALQLDAAPALASLDVATTEALGGETILVDGSGLLGVDAVSVGGSAAADVTVLADDTLSFRAPLAPALGAQAVVVTEGASSSNALSLTYVETDPPRVDAASSVAGGEAFQWTLGGETGEAVWLLVGFSPTTVAFKGHDLLASFVTLWNGVLDSRGLAVLPVTMPTGVGPLTLYSQIVTVGTDGLDVSAAVATTITL